jgi:hypothetical protein
LGSEEPLVDTNDLLGTADSDGLVRFEGLLGVPPSVLVDFDGIRSEHSLPPADRDGRVALRISLGGPVVIEGVVQATEASRASSVDVCVLDSQFLTSSATRRALFAGERPAGCLNRQAVEVGRAFSMGVAPSDATICVVTLLDGFPVYFSSAISLSGRSSVDLGLIALEDWRRSNVTLVTEERYPLAAAVVKFATLEHGWVVPLGRTDKHGRLSIKVPAGGGRLLVSPVGGATFEILKAAELSALGGAADLRVPPGLGIATIRVSQDLFRRLPLAIELSCFEWGRKATLPAEPHVSIVWPLDVCDTVEMAGVFGADDAERRVRIWPGDNVDL